VTSSLKRMAVAVGGVMAVRGMTRMITSSMEMIDATTKMSRRIGMATEDIMRLRYAAERAGVGADELDKSIETLVRRLGESVQGSGEATRGLEMLRLEARVLAEAGPAQAVRRIADAIKKLPTQAEKAAAAYYLMGRQGAKLLNLMELGSAGMIKAGEMARRTGVLFSQAAGRGVERANDALGDLKKLSQAVAQALAIHLAPAITDTATGLTNMATEGEGAGKRILIMCEAIGKGVALLPESINSVIHTFKQLHLISAKIAYAHQDLGETIKEFYRGYSAEGAAKLRKMREEIAQIEKQLNQWLVTPSFGERLERGFAAARRAMNETAATAKNAMPKVAEAVSDAAEAIAISTSSIDDKVQRVTRSLEKQLYELKHGPMNKFQELIWEGATFATPGIFDVADLIRQIERLKVEKIPARMAPFDFPAARGEFHEIESVRMTMQGVPGQHTQEQILDVLRGIKHDTRVLTEKEGGLAA